MCCEDYGMSINLTTVLSKDGVASVGFHLIDSNGMDIDIQHDGDNFNEVYDYILKECQKAITESLLNEAGDDEPEDDDEGVEDVAQMIVDLEDEIKSLKIDNQILQKRCEDLQDRYNNKAASEKKCCCSCNDNADAIEDNVRKMYNNLQEMFKSFNFGF